MDDFDRRVTAAAIARWWVVVLAAALLVLSWIAYLAVIPAQPTRLLPLWGPDLSWGYRTFGFWALSQSS
jgi:hypothetical protein